MRFAAELTGRIEAQRARDQLTRHCQSNQ
jgi:hypothetical protein